MNKLITSTKAYTTKQKQSPQTIATASKPKQKLLHKQPFPSLIHKVPSSTFICSSWMSFSSHYISQNAVQPRPELVTGTGWAGERASGSLTAPLRWIRSSAAGPSSTDQWRIFRESVPRGCLSLLKKQWHLQLTHTQKCVQALANLGARVSPGNPRGVEGRGAWPILTQPRQDFDWHSKLLHNFLTGVRANGTYHCAAQEGCLAYTHILQPSLFLRKNSGGTEELTGCQFNKEKKK